MSAEIAGPDRPDAVTGQLRLRIGVRNGRSTAVEQYHAGSLRVLRPHYLDASGQVCYTVINPGGGYLGGDRYRIDLDLDEGGSLLFTTQSATKVYRTPQAPARQHTDVRLAAGAVLESVPDPLIAYRDAEYQQLTRVEIDPAATYLASEIVTPGWSPDGARFGYTRVSLRTECRRPGADAPFLVDALLLEPAVGDVPGLGGLDGRSHLGSLLLVDARVDRDLVADVWELIEATPGVCAGASLAPGPALAVRVLGDDTACVEALLLAVDTAVRSRWWGLPPLNLRKP